MSTMRAAMARWARWPAAGAALAVMGDHSALRPAADQAGTISKEWWIFLAVLGTIWGIVVAVLLVATLRRRGEPEPLWVPPPLDVRCERRLSDWVMSAVAVTVLVLLALLFFDYFTVNAVSSPAPADARLIRVTGHQWWWEIRFEDPNPSRIVQTANELHIPAGQPVKFELNSNDVIHSFWVPPLHGKKDLIPGHPTSTWFIARNPGVYTGQCGEFCGAQHAHMQLTITVDPPEKFEAWLDAQRQSPPPPKTEAEKRGQQVFLKSTCFMCHSVQGTPARGLVGPDLTHVASRTWLGAGAVPNARGYLGGWILDPQTPKPGARMPQHTFTGEELTALLDYLETLK